MVSQFIHGKFVSKRGSEYQLVARSADLTDEAKLKTMAEKTHRFWGSTPPERMVKAVGIFLYDGNLVLVKAETAVNQNGQPAINGTREFNQHRYVFIPITSRSALQGRTLTLLSWMLKEPIPLLTGFNANLETLSIPVLEEPISAETRERKVEKLKQCWQAGNKQNSLLLSALAAIINGKRLLLTNEKTEISPQNWIESILLLLPASIRPQISVAIGTLDEKECPWAQLVVKTNQHSSWRLPGLPENIIWLNRANQKFHGKCGQKTFENPYVDYIRDHVATDPETLKQLLEQLDKITDDDITLESLADPKIIVRLIPGLPENPQDELLKKYFSGLNLDKWKELIELIIKEDYQQWLVFAWKELGEKAISEPKAIPLMLQVWSLLVNAQLLRLLYELDKNLPLAEILLKDKCLLDQPRREAENPIIDPDISDSSRTSETEAFEPSQPSPTTVYSAGYDPDAPSETPNIYNTPHAPSEISNTSNPPPISSLPSTTIEEKLIELCKKVVAEKAQSSCLEAWLFATNLADHQLFQDENKTFLLLDTALSGEITVTELYNDFTFQLAFLLRNVEAEQFKQSNLHRQLTTKNTKAANLLDTLLTEGNVGLAKLPQIANLIEMNNAAKDNWYAAFLEKWSPDREQANLLLVEAIKENQKDRNIFRRDELPQTYAWFEQQQPLKAIFDSLQNDYSCDNLDRLAQLVWENPQDQTDFVDALVGNTCPVAVMKKWLPLINSEEARTKLIHKSSAWQILTVDDFNQLVHSSQQYVTELTRCLRDSDGRLDWIKGDLLHYLCQHWIKVDEDLRAFITSPSVTNTFTTQDWLILQRLSWEPGIELKLPLGVKTALTPQQKTSLQGDVKTIVSRYTRPEQTRRLLNDCAAWGLDLTEQKEILKAVQPSACNVDLIISYLYREGKPIDPAEEQKLIELLLQRTLNNLERPDVAKFSAEVFAQYILPNRNMILLKWWQGKAVEKQLYKDAFSSAAQEYVKNISTTDFLNYLKDLKKYLLVEESGLMFKGAFSWIPDLLIQRIIDFISSSTF
jgi:hypothetical protein